MFNLEIAATRGFLISEIIVDPWFEKEWSGSRFLDSR